MYFKVKSRKRKPVVLLACSQYRFWWWLGSSVCSHHRQGEILLWYIKSALKVALPTECQLPSPPGFSETRGLALVTQVSVLCQRLKMSWELSAAYVRSVVASAGSARGELVVQTGEQQVVCSPRASVDGTSVAFLLM